MYGWYAVSIERVNGLDAAQNSDHGNIEHSAM